MSEDSRAASVELQCGHEPDNAVSLVEAEIDITRTLGPARSAAILAASAASAQPRPFTVRDLVAMDRVSSPVASPDGMRVVYVVSALDLDANRRRTDLWIVDIDGNSANRLTDHPASDSSPLWSRDGKFVWFLSTRTESSQVFRVSADGGEPEQMTKLPFDVNAFARRSGREAGRRQHGRVRRLRDAGVHEPAARRGRQARVERESVRPPVRPPLGHVGRRPALPPLRR